MATASNRRRVRKTDLGLAAKVSRDVTILGIALKNARVESDVEELATLEGVEYEQESLSRYELKDNGQRISVTVAFRFKALLPEPSQQPILRLEAEYVASYAVPEGKTYSGNALKYFAKLNGTVNLWPYWRELVHTVVTRVGLGSVVLPVFRARPTRIPESEYESE